MKMEGSNSELIKISSAKTADTGGLTFGPAWLRQLSSGDSTKMCGLPPSPGLTFQLAKHRYGREEMLAIYETIEKVIFDQPPSDALFAEFEDLLKRDLQRPVLLTQPSQEEQKYLSTCVNSAAALGAYSKIQGGPAGGGGRGGESGSIRGAGRGGRGASGQSGRGGFSSERGGGRGRGRGRGSSDGHGHVPKPPVLDEDGNPIPASRGGSRGGYGRGSYNRLSGNWEEREPTTKKEYSRAMADENWRSKASISETDETDEKDLTHEDRDVSESENGHQVHNSSSATDLKIDAKSKKDWRNNKEWQSSSKKYENKNKTYEKIEPHPEWLNDDGDDKDKKTDDIQQRMTFDESGKFVPIKEEKSEKELTKTKENKSDPEDKKTKNLDQKDQSDEIKSQTVLNESQTNEKIDKLLIEKYRHDLMSACTSSVPQNSGVKFSSWESERWLYLDPQNQIQGPFSSEQMAGWLTAGYFSMNLMVKRDIDENFVPLGILARNLGRMPFSSPPKNTPAQNSQQWSQDQIQMFLQTQFLPHNYNLLQAYYASQQKAGQNTNNLNQIIQQIKQIQLQQKAVYDSLGTLGVNGVLNNLNELRNKQEALINQCNLNSKMNQGDGFTGIDPAILDAALPKQSVWNEQPPRISPNLNPTPPSSISPINNFGSLNPLMNQGNMMAANHVSSSSESHPIKDKIQALFEITKMEEEKRRKLEKEQQIKLKMEEEERRRQELKQQQQEVAKRTEEERLREEMRKEQQKKKLLEIIKVQEEEKKRNEEIKRKKEEEKKKAEELKKQKEEQKRFEQMQKQLQEEAERKRQMEQQSEMIRKQAEIERQKQKQQQEQLNKLKLPSHAQWAKQQSSQLPNVDLKSVLEQQALEQKMMERIKQAEAKNQLQNSSSSTWSSLFQGQPQSPPNVSSSQNVSLTNIQLEQKNSEKAATTQKSQSKTVQPNSSKQPWSSWANATNNNQKAQTNDNNGGFWTDVAETKPKQSNPKQQNQVKPAVRESESKSNKKMKENQTSQQKVLHTMTISEEFMKWCHEQLKDFQVELHIPTFVNFLREIETCAEIEDYVINYLGESKQAKEFAQQFYINRQSQLSQQTNSKQANDDPSSQFNLRESNFSTKQKQKRRSKGHKLDNQLLGFTVQPDPSLKNRGDIDML